MMKCIVCDKDGASVIFEPIGFACVGECANVASSCSKDYAKSRRGRQRSPAEWVAAIGEIRKMIQASQEEKRQAGEAKLRAEQEQQARVHIRWMIRRDMLEVLGIEDHGGSLGWDEETCLHHLRQRNCIAMVAEVGKGTIDQSLPIGGFMVYELNKHNLRMLNFVVDPKMRKRGIGRKMIDKLKGKLASHRRMRLVFGVPDDNLGMLLFLKRMGFRAKPMQHGSDHVTMVYALQEEEAAIPVNRIEAFLAEGAE